MARLVGRTAVLVGLGLGAKAPLVLAQISPGKLSRSHASLEGSSQCLKCHDDRGVSVEKCSACHLAVKAQVAAGKGLHARPEYRDCKTCHVDHQGESFDLVWWGKAGREAFDHRLTGYALEGKHATLACPACHQPRFNLRKDQLAAEGANLSRTYLGLGTACLSCHADEHRGQFTGRDCLSCHALAGWKPPPRFDHAKTAYPLTGRHVPVACAKCHTAVSRGPGAPFRQYKGVDARECSSCHKDVHQGRLGAACATCHVTSGWESQKLGKFDHARTDYPLRGKHAPVPCDKCHAPGRPLRIPFARCTDCHPDSHLGQLARRADQGRCEACHEVSGFSPAKFLMEDHQKTTYPLAGAHLAVACDACHRSVAPEALRKIPGLLVAEPPVRAGRTPQLRFASTRCAECHRDPHLGELDRYAAKDGCAACHRVESWHQIAFDHAQTRFALSGGHAKPACSACHPKTDVGTPRARVRLAATPLPCASCHKDPHQGQLVHAGSNSCDGCHRVEDWKTTRFDHARDASFELDGAHVRLACAECHHPEKRGAVLVVRYKPLPRTCKGCHRPSAGRQGSP